MRDGLLQFGEIHDGDQPLGEQEEAIVVAIRHADGGAHDVEEEVLAYVAVEEAVEQRVVEIAGREVKVEMTVNERMIRDTGRDGADPPPIFVEIRDRVRLENDARALGIDPENVIDREVFARRVGDDGILARDLVIVPVFLGQLFSVSKTRVKSCSVNGFMSYSFSAASSGDYTQV